MTKAELIEIVAADTGLTKADTQRVYDSIFEAITKSLKKEGRYAVSGFGTFEVRKRSARKGRNPQTGETIKIKASKSVAFKQATALKSTIK